MFEYARLFGAALVPTPCSPSTGPCAICDLAHSRAKRIILPFSQLPSSAHIYMLRRASSIHFVVTHVTRFWRNVATAKSCTRPAAIPSHFTLTVSVLVSLVGGCGSASESHHQKKLIGRVDERVHGLRAHGARAAMQVRQELSQGDDQVAGQCKLKAASPRRMSNWGTRKTDKDQSGDASYLRLVRLTHPLRRCQMRRTHSHWWASSRASTFRMKQHVQVQKENPLEE